MIFFSAQIKTNFPLAFELARVSAELLKDKYDLEADEVEIGYLTVYFALFLEDRSRKSQPACGGNNQVAVVSNKGKGTFELLKRQIQSILGNDTLVQHISEKESQYVDLKSYDMIFALGYMNFSESIPVVRIANIFDKDHMEEQIRKIEKRSNSITEKELEDSMEISLFYLAQQEDYYAGVAHMIHELVGKNQLDKNFYQRWKARKKFQETVFDGGIAIPHAENKNHEKFVLSVGIYPDEIKQKDQPVKIVFLIGVPEKITYKNQKFLTFIYEKIFSIGSNKE